MSHHGNYVLVLLNHVRGIQTVPLAVAAEPTYIYRVPTYSNITYSRKTTPPRARGSGNTLNHGSGLASSWMQIVIKTEMPHILSHSLAYKGTRSRTSGLSFCAPQCWPPPFGSRRCRCSQPSSVRLRSSERPTSTYATLAAAQKVFNLDIVNAQLSPDGFVRDTVSPNGTFPGPTFALNKGDSVVIHTHNKLTDPDMRRSTSIV
jgi:hypothetical protein